MTAPKITRSGTFRLDAIMADVFDDNRFHAVTVTNIVVDIAQARELHGQRVTVTIEPADAPRKTAPTLEQIKVRLIDALKRNMGSRVRSVSAGDIATDLADEVMKMIEEARP